MIVLPLKLSLLNEFLLYSMVPKLPLVLLVSVENQSSVRILVLPPLNWDSGPDTGLDG